MNEDEKSRNRHHHSNVMVAMVVMLAVSTVVMAYTDKLSADFALALGVLLGYAGNHTYQNYKTTPKSGD